VRCRSTEVLYRAFPSVEGAEAHELGGPLFVPRLDQGLGRHDNPERYGALYLSREPVSNLAEVLRGYAGRTITERHLRPEGAHLALATLDDAGLGDLLDLDDPHNLVARELRPSRVATRDRGVTRELAGRLYDEEAPGFEWWSTIEASWINVTLFAERVLEHISVIGEPEELSLDHPAVREAAEAVGVELGA
jgi:hypothetical protein